jgi:hypothetical protein
MDIKKVAVDQITEFDLKTVITATCFSAVSLFAAYINLTFWAMLVQYRIDNGDTTVPFATAAEYMEAIPNWATDAYNLLTYLSLALLIWIFINIAHLAIITIQKAMDSYRQRKSLAS